MAAAKFKKESYAAKMRLTSTCPLVAKRSIRLAALSNRRYQVYRCPCLSPYFAAIKNKEVWFAAVTWTPSFLSLPALIVSRLSPPLALGSE